MRYSRFKVEKTEFAPDQFTYNVYGRVPGLFNGYWRLLAVDFSPEKAEETVKRAANYPAIRDVTHYHGDGSSDVSRNCNF